MEGVVRQRGKRGLRLGLLLLVVLAALAGVYLLSDIFAPLILGFLIAYVLDPFADALEKAKFSRLVSVVIIFAIFTVVAVIFFTVAGFYIAKGVQGGYEAVMGEEWKLEDVHWTTIDTPDKTIHFEDRDGDGEFDPGYLRRANKRINELIPDEWREGINERIESFVTEFKEDPNRVRERALAVFNWWKARKEQDGEEVSAGGGLFGIVSWFVFCPLYVFFFLLEIDPMIAGIRKHLPGRYRPQIERIFSKIDRILSAFFRGRLTICLIKGSLTSVGLLAFGVPFWFPIGMAAGFLSLIPYIGIWLAILPALGLSWVEHDVSLVRLGGVAAVFIIMETVEGLVLLPAFLGKEVGLHPLTIIVTLLIFGRIFGFVGVLLSVPLAAITKILFHEFIMPLIKDFAAEKPRDDQRPPPDDEGGNGETAEAAPEPAG